jgi:hypothetical protein
MNRKKASVVTFIAFLRTKEKSANVGENEIAALFQFLKYLGLHLLQLVRDE